MGFPRQEYQSGLPFLTPEDLPHPGIEPKSFASPALIGGFFTTVPHGKPHISLLFFQSLSHVRLFATLWTAACQASLSFTIFQSLLKLISFESVMPFNHLILCCPLFPLLSIFLNIRVFSNESVLRIRWPKNWNFSLSISPCNEYSGLILLGLTSLISSVQGALKSLLQHHNSKATILQCSAFFMVQLSHFYMTTGMIIWTFVRKMMSLLFNTLSSFVITFLPKGKNLSIVAAVTSCSGFRAKENKIYHCFHFFPIYLP